jgi:hypothetical protein
LKVGQRVEVKVSDKRRLHPGGEVQIEDEDENEQEERTKTPTITPTPGGPTATPTATRTPASPTPTRTPEREDEQEREAEGTISSLGGSSFTILTKAGPVTVQTNAATQFRRGGDSRSFADLRIGQKVEVKGQLQPDQSILASRVSIEDRGPAAVLPHRGPRGRRVFTSRLRSRGLRTRRRRL